MKDCHLIQCVVNDADVQAEVESRMTLADFLRDHLGLTGTHLGCEHGVCGACTVRVGGDAVRSCLMLAVQADGREVTTVEGLGTLAQLSPLQEAFRDKHGLQCGFCTPGMLVSMQTLIDDHTDDELTPDEVREALSGNLCRCTGYAGIVEATQSAAKEQGGAKR